MDWGSVQVWQIITNATLTVVGICVAMASLIVAYRNNFGWAPIALISGYGLKGFGPDPKNVAALLTLEVWNRRKYPIIVRFINLKFDSLPIKERLSTPAGEVWHIRSRYVSHLTPHTLDPTSHETHEIEIPLKPETLDGLESNFRVRIEYFDPRSNQRRLIDFKNVYSLKPPEPIFA
jgi:hypothetical protein